MKELTLHALLQLLFSSIVLSQNYIGAGNDASVTVTSSDQYQNSNWPKAASGINTVNGVGLDAEQMDAARFLMQSSIGFEEYHIDEVVSLGIENWIDYQMGLAQTKILPKVEEFYQIKLDSMAVMGQFPHVDEFRPRWWSFNYAWWDQMMRNEDLLRHKVAVALSEIFVISRKSELQSFGDGFGDYYDMLAGHAFGNFEKLLLDVTLHPCMGEYLSHLNNPKADPSQNIHPDENYAREIMQLFSIGLYELNIDGTRKLNNGQLIPTYDQDDVREYAKVFTGLSVADWVTNPYGDNSIYWDKSIWSADVTKPMIMYEDYHEPGPKYLLKGQVIPAGQTGMQDIKDAIHNLYMHPNVGPFIGYRLIQRLVKSNPSPEYVARVAKVFNNNGNGVRGDMSATIKSILMDPEARACYPQNSVSSSRLKEPLMRYTHFVRTADKYSPYNFLWNANSNFANSAHQDLFDSPSVFNFYLPDHSPNGDIADANLFAPEFNLHNTLTSPGYVNEVYRWTIHWGHLIEHWEAEFMSDNYRVFWDINSMKELAKDVETLVNKLDMLFTYGNLSTNTRSILRSTLSGLNSGSWYDHLEWRVRLGVYLILISPDYVIMR